jgi:hypothetical protein
MHDKKGLAKRHREQLYKLEMIRVLGRVMRDHVGPRMMAEAEDKAAAKWAVESVGGLVQSWESAERYGAEQAARRLEFGVPPDEWDILKALGLHD